MSHQTVTVAERWNADAALPVDTATVTPTHRALAPLYRGTSAPELISCCPPWRIVSTLFRTSLHVAELPRRRTDQ